MAEGAAEFPSEPAGAPGVREVLTPTAIDPGALARMADLARLVEKIVGFLDLRPSDNHVAAAIGHVRSDMPVTA